MAAPAVAAHAAPPASPAAASPAGATPAPVAVDPLLASRLLWSTMAAVDQANRTGNYSVLRGLGAPGFQTANTDDGLARVFATLRAQRLDLSYTLVVTPTFEFPPAIGRDGTLRLRGVFPLRPTAIGFDMLFQNVDGQWRIFALAVLPLVARTQQSGSTTR